MEAIIKGMMGQKAEKFDANVVSDVTESLFANVDFPGSDLIARNIHRGRDHGLPGYNEYRKDIYEYLDLEKQTLSANLLLKIIHKQIMQGNMWHAKGVLVEFPTRGNLTAFVGQILNSV